MMRYKIACVVVSIGVWSVGVGAQSKSTLADFSHAPSAFPDILNPYKPNQIPPLELANSPRISELLKDGKLRLSLSQALALAIENNLDIAVQRFVHPIAEADLLRTTSGQAARGIPGGGIPAGLSAGALGVGVNAAGGTGGVGAAGGISGGGGAVSVPQSGTFDPAITFSSSYDRTVSPLNSTVVSGVPQVTTTSSAGSVGYTQLFPTGSSITMAVNGIAQNSTQGNLLFNPAVVSRFAAGVNQPLLNGAGLLANRRFLLVAENNMNTSDELFREQVTTIVVQVEDTYWGLAAARQAIAAAERTASAATELVKDTQTRVEFGTAAGLDVVSAQSAAASAQRDLIVAQTNFQLQQAQLKNLLTKETSPEIDRAEVETTDALPDPGQQTAPDLTAALKTALDNRPELKTAGEDLQNQDISVRYTRNGLLPSLSVFALYAGAGLTGDTRALQAGIGQSFHETFDAAYPEYAAGVSAAIPIRNRSAQADNIRARLEEQQLRITQQKTRQQIELEVRQAVIGLQQGKAQVDASREARRLAERTAGAEREKLQLGVSTAYDVILRERDLVTAQQNEVSANAAYARALVEFDRATGQTLDRNGIALNDALSGQMLRQPTPSMVRPDAKDEPR